MADYPYTTVPGKLSEFLGKIQQLGIPEKVNTRWLPTVGFASKNDRSLIPVLKYISLISESGEPTEVWKEFRGAGGGRALGRAVQAAYRELFATYPDANVRTTSELQAFFRGHSSYGAQAVSKAVATFKAICQHAEFDGERTESVAPDQIADPVQNGSLGAAMQVPTPPMTQSSPQSRPSLHIDIQIHISPEASTEQIEKIFESMGKHLYGKDGSE
ncbi:DUF5343 domain-containing protein [Marinobacter sp.]|uniref:DUF5343 domain-containing protein n=1 Tax=Marinobacter sp. TaxID=50741 RepID=UPI003BAA3B54